jgi:hypothetical protein
MTSEQTLPAIRNRVNFIASDNSMMIKDFNDVSPKPKQYPSALSPPRGSNIYDDDDDIIV